MLKANKKANKMHTCTMCAGSIAKGEQYYRESYPIMRGCSPEKSPDEVICPTCIDKCNALKAARQAAHCA